MKLRKMIECPRSVVPFRHGSVPWKRGHLQIVTALSQLPLVAERFLTKSWALLTLQQPKLENAVLC